MTLAQKIDKCESAEALVINNNLMEVRRQTKRTPAYLKIAVPDKVAERFLKFGRVDIVGFGIFIDRNEWERPEMEGTP
ncbi:MAG: hypothetical protein GXX10_01775 [Clostridiaceae bacterium]|nr:hypothetical protein [Clostridiaceae bacterium]